MEPEVSAEACERVRHDLEWMQRSTMRDRVLFPDAAALDYVLLRDPVPPADILSRIDVYREGRLERADRQPRQ